MKISIHQPNFVPWYPFFQKIQQCDKFIILTHCQFEKNGYQNRFNFNDKGWVTLRKTESPNTAKIESIQAFEPGKGFGNEVMQALVKKADETGVTLIGNVEPFGNEERMSKEQLEEFYKRFGFQVYEEGDITKAVRLVPVKVKLQGFKRKY